MRPNNVPFKDDAPQPSFPIVAIGASAGGLNALQCFMAALPKDFGFTVVFMQHLSPTHKSLLPGLLRSARPDIEIYEVSDGMEVLPGRIYLCPPGKETKILKETFQLSDSPQDPIHLPIDDFFVSLAEEAGERVIAVIFSGAGTDGARGVQTVRTAGGTVFVQNPSTAEFASMPLAAISTGVADGVLEAGEIAGEILKLHGAVAVVPEEDFSTDDLDIFYRLVREKTGHRFEHYKKTVVGRRIRRRMYLRGVSSIHDYVKMVSEKDSEAFSLASDLMIGVTSFFRDRLAWKALKTGVIRKLAAQDEDSPVRVWTPACATGEEAYSIAMMLQNEFELAIRMREIQVFATDVNVRALEKARAGKYPGSVTADVPPDFMKKYFACSEDGNSVIISREVREKVVFAKQDILTDPPFSRLDLIICRNLLIYLEPKAQEKCISLFHYALKDGGYLFMGNAESVGRNKMLFRSISHKKCRLYQKLETKPSSRLPLTVPFAQGKAVSPPLRQAPSPARQPSVAGLVQENLLERHTPAAVAIDEHYDILYHNGPTNLYLRQPRGAPTQNLLELIPENLRNRVRGAVYRAVHEGRNISIRGNIPDDGGRKRQVTFRISKLEETVFLVVFSEKGAATEQAGEVSPESAVDDTPIRQLEIELSATRAELQSNIEQLKSLNEELQSSNEELQAANEELETSREELQSLNEELITVNSQLQGKVEEQEETNNDLNNFLTSTSIPTVFLDTRLRVKRFTPAMSKLLKLIPSDVGRPIADMSQESVGPELIADAQAVLDQLVPVKKEMLINQAWYVRSTLPYRTSDNRIEGVVITYNDVTELKEVEERTKHLASFPQINPNPVIEVSASGKITFFNPATERTLEELGMEKANAGAFLPPDLDLILNELEKKEEATLYRETIIKDRVFGETVHAVHKFNVIRIYAFDITERKKAEKKMRDSEERLNKAQEIAHLGSWELDLVNDSLTWSDEVYRLFGLQPQEFGATYEAFLERVHPDDRAAVDAAYSGSIREGKDTYEIEHRVVRKDTDEVRIVHEKCRHVRDESGRILRSVGMVHDITEIKQAEKELRQSEMRLRRFYESGLIGVMYWNMAGVITDANDKFLEIIGYTREELNSGGINWVSITSPEYRRIDELSIEELKATGVNRTPFEKEYIRKDGTRVRILVAGAMLDEERFNGVAFVMDVTERKKAEERITALNEQLSQRVDELMAANKELESFSYSVSHDLRAPLRHLTGFAELLKKRVGTELDKKSREYVEFISGAAVQMGRLVDDLLSFSRAGRVEIKRQQMHLDVMVRGVIRSLGSEAGGRDVEWKVQGLPEVSGDPSLLRLVWTNLISNAFKFTRTKKHAIIEIGSRDEGSEYVFFIKDNGVGFDMKFKEKLFAIFQRLHSPAEFEGTGVGLANVQRIVSRHGGRVWAESEEGEGATFYFTLPK